MPKPEADGPSRPTAEERVAAVIVGIVIALFGVFFTVLVYFTRLHKATL